jgi:UDP-2-acetamido-3-amino-2,3-dideoxy-glucuronate N-acetyltransferase
VRIPLRRHPELSGEPAGLGWQDQVRESRTIEAHFASIAAHWNDLYGKADASTLTFRERQATALAWIERLNLPPKSRVLDAGCGAGHAAVALARRGFQVDAIDAVASMVELARQNACDAGQHERVAVRLGDVHALDAEAGQYDLVIALGVIPWLHSPAGALREIERVLKPGGYAIVTCDNRRALTVLLDPMRSPWLEETRRVVTNVLRRSGLRQTPPHGARARFHRRCDLDALIAQAGLRKVSWRTHGFAPLTMLGHTLPESIGFPMLRWLQRLADRGVPGLRAGGSSYMVLARKANGEIAPRIHRTADVAPDARVGAGTLVWNEVQIRAGAQVGRECVLGKGVFIDVGVIVGSRVKLENRVSIFQGALIADGVFIGPHSCLLNDRLPRAITPEGALKTRADWQARGVAVAMGASIGGGCTVLPGVHIGRFAMVGAGAVVTRDVPDFGLVLGNPARLVGYVCECGTRLSTSGECPDCGRRHPPTSRGANE